ncbi:hypothetical protein [Mycobacterium sp. ACS4331]|uniref:hypothetical protein n=1 Tax=Mycobacterium sp. ACS4331 TaxID=1834121 RepID=UPI000800FDE6|nr:hypothetical protein [Mycobacterium sp. ACS4331]OBF30454.1 hypothetical protein A5727_00120 [Mycobacterium sp. ACS4331]
MFRDFGIKPVVAGALALAGLGLAAPALVDSVGSDTGSESTVIGVSAPTYEFDDFGELHNRGPRAGVNGPGFAPERPIVGPASDGR